jgi:hypothetical protein
MLSPEEIIEQTGHVIGGVCPFGLADIFKSSPFRGKCVAERVDKIDQLTLFSFFD